MHVLLNCLNGVEQLRSYESEIRLCNTEKDRVIQRDRGIRGETG